MAHAVKRIHVPVAARLAHRRFGVCSDDDALLRVFAKKPQTYISLRHLMETGRMLEASQLDPETNEVAKRLTIQAASFLHRELPVRVAHRAIELESIPYYKDSEHIQQVAQGYKDTFRIVRDLAPPVNEEKEKIFAQSIADIYDRHAATLVHMAKGAHEIRNALVDRHGSVQKAAVLFEDERSDIQRRLDEFYFSRIGIRVLLGQYLALREPPVPGLVGLMQLKVFPKTIVQQAVDNAAFICSRTHGDAPPVQIETSRPDMSFPYITSHMEYILMELLKNSMRATVETHGVDDMPPIKIVIADGEENDDVVIKISDTGGGIKRSTMKKVWSYLYTTGDPSVLQNMLDTTTDSTMSSSSADVPLAGLGYGLPIARCYARYFGGDLQIVSVEGHGTDSYIFLPRLRGKDLAVPGDTASSGGGDGDGGAGKGGRTRPRAAGGLDAAGGRGKIVVLK